MKKIVRVIFVFVLLAGCVKIPVQSVDLADALMEEGERMHKVNLAFASSIFNTKRSEIDRFVEKEYTPAMIKNFTLMLPANANASEELPKMMKAIIPEINLRKDSLVNGLELQKERLITKLNTDYKIFENAAATLKRLLESAAREDKEKAALYSNVKDLSKNKVDLTQIEKILNDYVRSAGSAGSKINDLKAQLEPYLNK
jgi:hypothetical protein